MGISQTNKRSITTQMATYYQSHQTQPGQLVAASFIHSSVDDSGIAIIIYTMKVTVTGLQIVTFYSKTRDKKVRCRLYTVYLRTKINLKIYTATQHSNKVIRRKHKHILVSALIPLPCA